VGRISLTFQEPLIALPFATSRVFGALILVDMASHKTSGDVMVNEVRRLELL
jgi:sulfate adenylyltransferase subunit 1 (EFTu-like GTPase family)